MFKFDWQTKVIYPMRVFSILNMPNRRNALLSFIRNLDPETEISLFHREARMGTRTIHRVYLEAKRADIIVHKCAGADWDRNIATDKAISEYIERLCYRQQLDLVGSNGSIEVKKSLLGTNKFVYEPNGAKDQFRSTEPSTAGCAVHTSSKNAAAAATLELVEKHVLLLAQILDIKGNPTEPVNIEGFHRCTLYPYFDHGPINTFVFFGAIRRIDRPEKLVLAFSAATTKKAALKKLIFEASLAEINTLDEQINRTTDSVGGLRKMAESLSTAPFFEAGKGSQQDPVFTKHSADLRSLNLRTWCGAIPQTGLFFSAA